MPAARQPLQRLHGPSDGRAGGSGPEDLPGAGGRRPHPHRIERIERAMSSPPQSTCPDPAVVMRSIIKRIATGPELSKDISREEARQGMRFVLEGEVDPVQAGIFLIALRMKRETDEE